MAIPTLNVGDGYDDGLRIEQELIERQLARRSLEQFVSLITPGFSSGWHIQELCGAVEALEAMIQTGHGTEARLAVEAPPRHSKTQCISRGTPLWYLGRHPNHEVIIATYNQDLADDLGRWAKQEVESPLYTSIFPELELRKDSRAANRLDTVQGGSLRYVGVGGPVTGRGAHLAIVDDPIKNSEDADSPAMSKMLWNWYTSVLRTRLHPGGGIIVLHTRWRVNDLIGRLISAAEEGKGEPFKRVTFRAMAEEDDEWGRKPGEPLHPQRYSAEDLQALRQALPTRDWLALYQQRPTKEDGNIFTLRDFNMYKPGTSPDLLYWYIATDYGAGTRSANDPTCIWPFGVDVDGCIWWSPDFDYGRYNTHESTKRTLDLAKQFKAVAIIIEGGILWQSIKPEFQRQMRKRSFFPQIINPAPSADKYARSRASHGMMSAGMMRFPDTRRVHELVIPEFMVFTGINDDHDEFIDTVAWAGKCSTDMILPTAQNARDAAADGDEEDEEDEVVPWSYADILRRAALPEPSRAKHSPPSLTGRTRRKGSRYRYC